MSINHYIAGGISGLIEVSVTFPFDTLKTRYQLGSSAKGNLYSGFNMRALSVVPMRFIFWGTREQSLQYGFSPLSSGIIAGFCQCIIDTPVETYKVQHQMGLKSTFKSSFNNYNRNFLATCSRNVPFSALFTIMQVSGFPVALCAATAAFITHPFDTIKSRVQVIDNRKIDYKSIFELKGLQKGIILRSVMTAINISIGFGVYSFLINQLKIE